MWKYITSDLHKKQLFTNGLCNSTHFYVALIDPCTTVTD